MRIGSVRSLRKIAVGMGALAIACVTVPAFAGDIETTNNGGGSTNPNPGSIADVSWNPTNECTVAQGETINELLGCMASYIDPVFFCDPQYPVSGGAQLPPGYAKEFIYPGDRCPEPYLRSDFVVHYISDPPIGIQIQRWDPDPNIEFPPSYAWEPARLFIYENDPNIQWVTVNLPRPGMLGKFGLVTETANGGSIILKVNGTTLPAVTTTWGESPLAVNKALTNKLTAAGFAVQNDGTYLIVTGNGTSITTVSWRSFDTGIVKSTLSIDTDPNFHEMD